MEHDIEILNANKVPGTLFVIVTRKANKKVVILSLERFNLMEKEIRSSQYLAKLDRAFDQLYAGIRSV